jgi:hypothetical protein
VAAPDCAVQAAAPAHRFDHFRFLVRAIVRLDVAGIALERIVDRFDRTPSPRASSINISE